MPDPSALPPRKTGGGAATSAGIDFQNRVAAWLAVRVLAEKESQPLWGWPAHSTLTFIRCETEQPVDDILLGSSNDGFGFIQVKHTLGATKGADSALGSVFDQFVRQWLRPEVKGVGVPRPWDRRFDRDRDKLVALVGRSSSATVTLQLPALLAKLRELPDQSPAATAQLPVADTDLLATIRNHVNAAWGTVSKTACSDQEFTDFLRCVYVELVDADRDGPAEREAKELLRRTILHHPNDADLAWAKLLELCAGYSKSHGGAARDDLRERLVSANVALKAPASYRADVERLRTYTRDTVDSLEKLAEIRVGVTARVKIQRHSTGELQVAANAGSLLVIGEPGAGKSGALYDMASALLKQGCDVVCFATDRIEASSLARLKDELHLDHSLTEVLKNWGGAGPVYFITDALDAARSDHAGAMFREVINNALNLGSRCRVVASIRMFDLRHDTKLRALFAGKPATEYNNPEFGSIRHFLVPVLDQRELDQLATQAPDLAGLVQAVMQGDNDDMRRLITVPFNLRLLGELIGEGSPIASLTPIRTQIELLDRYWNERVLRTDGQGDARETVLRAIADSMFKSRLLHASRAVVKADANSSAVLADLLSADILQHYAVTSTDGHGRNTVKFPHHLLFDYALSRLLFRVDHQSLVKIIADDPDCVVAFRPSLVLHFRYTWAVNPGSHASFWNLLLTVEGEPKIPLVGKIIAPTVAVECFQTVADFDPFFETARASLANADQRKTMVRIVSHLTGAQAARGKISRNDQGAEALRWGGFAAALSEHPEAFAYPLRHLLSMLCDPPDRFPEAALDSTSKAARRLLAYALVPTTRYDAGLVRGGLESVCRTFAGAPAESGKVLRKLLEPDHAKQYGHTELFFFAQEVPRLVALDPALVAEIYKIAFTHASDSTEKAYLGGPSRIMPLITNVRQEWQGVQYSLAKSFPDFLRKAPRLAIEAALVGVAAFAVREHPSKSGDVIAEQFAFLGRECRIITDYSSIWDSRSSVHSGDSSAIELLYAVQRYLEKLDSLPDAGAQIDELLAIIAEGAQHAVVWRRLLQSGSEHPKTLGYRLRSLLWEPGMLSSFDVMEEVGNLLESLYPLITEGERQQIETAIVNIDRGPTHNEEANQHLRDRYLGCLPRELVATSEARDRLLLLDADKGPPPNSPHFRMSSFESSNADDEDFLRHRGIPVDEPANRELLELIRPFKASSRSTKGAAEAPEPSEVLEARYRKVLDALANADKKGINSDLKDNARAYLAEACAMVLQRPVEANTTALRALARSILLQVATETPADGPLETNANFDSMPGWGSPDAAISAVEGLMLAKDAATTGDKSLVEAAITRLRGCPRPEVRYQVARLAPTYAESNPERTWALLEFYATNDPSSAILTAVVSTLSRTSAARGIGLVQTIFERSKELPESEKLRAFCLSYFLALYLRDNHAWSSAMISGIVDTPWARREYTLHLISDLRGYLAFGEMEPAGTADTPMRHRAQQVLYRLLQSINQELARLIAEYDGKPYDEIAAPVREKIETLHRCVDSIADQVYFASGTFDLKSTTAGRGKLSTEQRRRFWEEMKPVIAMLATSRVPNVGFHLMELLGALVEFAPKEVFLKLSLVVQNGKEGGFQYETLVAELAVRVVQEFIATHHALLKDDKECRHALIEILDTFVEAGWPAAQQLTYGLEDIFR